MKEFAIDLRAREVRIVKLALEKEGFCRKMENHPEAFCRECGGEGKKLHRDGAGPHMWDCGDCFGTGYVIDYILGYLDGMVDEDNTEGTT